MASFDPLAGSQIDVDPSLKPKMSQDAAKRRQQLIEMFMQGGATLEQATLEADRYMADYPTLTGMQAPAAPAPPAPAPPVDAPAAPVAPPVSKKSHANLGRTWGGARDFESEEDRDNYQARRTLTPAEKEELRAQGMTAAEIVQMQMSQQDIDMLDSGVYGAGQGWVPVYDPLTGRQTFKQRAPEPPPLIPGGHLPDGLPPGMGGSEAVTGHRRIGERVDNRELQPSLRNKELEDAGYSIERFDGPNGPEWVYHMNRPGDKKGVTPRRAEQLAQYDAVYENRQLQRIAASAGVDPAEAEAAFEKGGMDAVRKLANTSRTRNQQARQNSFSRTMQSRYNPMEYLGRNDINQWQQFVAAEQMLGGGGGFDVSINPKTGERRLMVRRGMDPNQVQATNNQQLLDIGRRVAMNPNALPGNNDNPAMQAQMDAQARAANPAAAGQRDIASGNYESQEAQGELNRLAASFDNTTGGMSLDNERALASALQRPPYNMPQAEAEAYAYRYAEKRRRLWNQGGGPAGQPKPAPAPAAPGLPPPPPGGNRPM